jgi:hypothetical protein
MLAASERELSDRLAELAQRERSIDEAQARLEPAAETVASAPAGLEVERAELERAAAALDDAQRRLDEERSRLAGEEARLAEREAALVTETARVDQERQLLTATQQRLDAERAALESARAEFEASRSGWMRERAEQTAELERSREELLQQATELAAQRQAFVAGTEQASPPSASVVARIPALDVIDEPAWAGPSYAPADEVPAAESVPSPAVGAEQGDDGDDDLFRSALERLGIAPEAVEKRRPAQEPRAEEEPERHDDTASDEPVAAETVAADEVDVAAPVATSVATHGAAASERSAASDTTSGDDDVDEYMKALLARLGNRNGSGASSAGGFTSGGSAPTPGSAFGGRPDGRPSQSLRKSMGVERPAGAEAPTTAGAATEAGEACEVRFEPRVAAERSTDMAAIRELANLNAKRLLDTSSRRRLRNYILATVALAAFLGLAGGFMIWVSQTTQPFALLPGCLCLLGSVAWLLRAGTEFSRLALAKESSAAEAAADRAPGLGDGVTMVGSAPAAE